MIKHLFAILSILALLSPLPARAANKALLIGVGEYPYLGMEAQLQGPAEDIKSLKKVLTSSWGFNEADVWTLVDSRATRESILRAVANLSQTTAPGDFVFVYFSGHGTSAFDKDSGLLAEGIDPTSGALIPTDFKDGTNDEMLSRLIIGKRDLQPLFKNLEKDREVFVVFDSCYSGRTVRGGIFGRKAKYRFVPLNWKDEERRTEAPKPPPSKNPPYPYQRIIYFSAASNLEKAKDLNPWETHDGQPHGAMTDALLKGLKGAADTNKDSNITYDELYCYARDSVSRRHNHTPQLLAPAGGKGLTRAVFAKKIVQPAPPAPPAPLKELKILCKGLDQSMISQLAVLEGVSTTEDAGIYDLIVSREGSDIALYLGNDCLLSRFPGAGGGSALPLEVLERVKRQVRVQSLLDIENPSQPFNVFLKLVGPGGVLSQGSTIGFTIKPEADSHILLFNIDSGGSINVIYPYDKSELAKVRAGSVLDLSGMGEVEPPFGTEYLKAVAFKNKPRNLERLMGGEFPATDPRFNDLLRMIQDNLNNSAQMTLQVKTCSRENAR